MRKAKGCTYYFNIFFPTINTILSLAWSKQNQRKDHTDGTNLDVELWVHDK